jgi:hypothetical protein
MKFNEEISKITYKQQREFKKIFIKQNIIQKLYGIHRNVRKEWERPQQLMENGKLFY